MNTKKVISRKNLPTISPIMGTVVYATALHYWNAPEWLWGSLGLIMIIIWIGWAVNLYNQESIDIMEEPKSVKSKFKERLEEALAKKGEK